MTTPNAAPHAFTAKKKALVAALLASASFTATTGTAAACDATDSTSYDNCVTNIGADNTVNLAGNATTGVSWTTGGILNINSGTLTDTAGANFGNHIVALTVASGATLTLAGFEQFNSVAGGGTIDNPVQFNFGFDGANTAFSGTITGGAIEKTGAGSFTVNGMTHTGSYIIARQGSLVQSGGTTSLSGIYVGGGGLSPSMSISGGTLNVTGTTGLITGYANTANATVTQSGGTVNLGTVAVSGPLTIAYDGGETGTTSGTYAISGGTLNLGAAGGASGVHSIARAASAGSDVTGTMNISGGTVNLNVGSLVNGDRSIGGGATTLSTVNLSGGTLSIKAGATLYLTGDDNANLIDSIFNLSGNGTLEVGDSGLQGIYTGGEGSYEFNLNGGQIRVAGSDLTTTVNAILLGASATAGTQINTNGLNANWNGVLSGAGWIVKTGTGTLNLGGVNTYTGGTAFNGGTVVADAASDLGALTAAMSFNGGTAFNGGTVVADAASDLGALTAAMSFNGGTLQLGAGGVLTNRTGGTNMAGAGTIDTNGFTAFYDGNITGAGALTKAGAGTLDLGGTNDAHTGAVNVTAGQLHATFGHALGNTSAVTVSAGATLQIEGNETIGSLAGAGELDIIDGDTLTTGGNNSSTTWTGTTTATSGALTKAGTGTFTVNNNLTYTGLTTVSGGTMLLNGTMAGNLLIASGATFGGNAVLAGDVTNNGTVSPGNSPGTQLYGGNYTGGAGSVFDMEVQFDNAAAPVNGTTHDFVNVIGNASGTTLLNVIPFAPSGSPAATTGNGIELVRVAGTTGATQFALAAPVALGSLEYSLVYLPNYSGALDGYFLQSGLSSAFVAEGAMVAANQTLMGNCFRGEDSLIGDGNGQVGRAWGKVTHGGLETGADTGFVSDQEYTCGSGGIDLRTGESLRFGISGGYGETSSDVTTSIGVGLLEGDGGMIQFHAAMYHGAFFANLGLGYGQSNWIYTGPAQSGDASLNGFIASLQAGGSWPIANDWRFGAIAEVSYDGLNCDDDCLLPGTVMDEENVFLKGTLRVDGSLSNGKLRPFVALSLANAGENSFTNGPATLSTDTNAMLLGAKGGATFMLGEKTALFANGGLTEGLNNDVTGWDGTAGVKLFW